MYSNFFFILYILLNIFLPHYATFRESKAYNYRDREIVRERESPSSSSLPPYPKTTNTIPRKRTPPVRSEFSEFMEFMGLFGVCCVLGVDGVPTPDS